jgi:hypothetical protein
VRAAAQVGLHGRHQRRPLQDRVRAAGVLGADLNAPSRRERLDDRGQVPSAGLHRDVQADVGEVDRQPGILNLRQGRGQLYVVGGGPLGGGGVGDELPEEVHAGRDAPIAEAGNDSEHVLDGLAGDVAAGHGVGTPLQGQGSTHLLFEALAGDELEQQPPP